MTVAPPLPTQGQNPWGNTLNELLTWLKENGRMPDSPTDGQIAQYNEAAGEWLASNPVGNSLNVKNQNVTGVVTSVSAGPSVGFGSFVDIPNTGIPVLDSGGREVVIEFEAAMQQSVIGTGTFWLALAETTSGVVYRRYNKQTIPNSITTGARERGLGMVSCNIGVVTTTRTFKLVGALYAVTGSPTVQIINQQTEPSSIRAINI